MFHYRSHHIRRTAVALCCALGMFALVASQRSSANQPTSTRWQSPQRVSEADRIFAEAEAAEQEDATESRRRAIALFERAGRLYQAAGDKPREAWCLMAAAASATKLAEFELVIRFLTQTLPTLRAAKQTSLEAVTLKNIGLAWSGLGDRQKALEYFQQSLELYRALRETHGEADMLDTIGAAWLDMEDGQRALEHFQQALDLSRTAQDLRIEASALHNIGRVWEMQGDRLRAMEYYRQALPLRQKAQDRNGEAGTLLNMGRIMSDVGEKQEGLALLQRALSICQTLYAPFGQATVLNSIGLLWLERGQFQEALGYFQQALPLHQSIKSQAGVAETRSNLGMVFAELGENEEALKHLNEALLIYRALKSRRGEAAALSKIGSVMSAMQEKQRALDVFREMLRLSREVKDKFGESVAHNNIGLTLSELGRKQEALLSFEQALQLKQFVRDSASEATTLNNIGLIWYELKQYPKALDYYLRALPIYHAVEDRHGEMVALSNIALVYHDLQQPLAANAFAKLSVNLLQQFRASQRSLDKESQRAFLRRYETVYSLLADWLLAEERLPEAQQAIHLARDQEFYDPRVAVSGAGAPEAHLLALTPAEKELQDRLLAALDRVTPIGSRLTQLQTQLGTRQPAPSESAQLEQLNAALAAESASLQKLLPQLNAGLNAAPASDHRLPETKDLTDMQGMLRTLEQRTRTKAAAIYTLMGPKECRTLLVTADTISSASAKIEFADLDRKVELLPQRLQSDRYDPQAPGRELYDVIFKPIEPQVRKSGATLLLWSLDRSQRTLPMAALWDGRQYLAERFQHAVFTRPTPERMLREVSRTWTGQGFGTSKAWPGFNPLLGVGRELQLIFGGAKTGLPGVIAGQTVQDEGFTKQSFLNGLKQRKPLAHIASHFSFRAGNDSGSFLLLGNGDRLTLAEMKQIPGLFDGVELLTLSACNTATQRGDDRFGREVDGFAEQAQRLGAAAVMASLWEVSDVVTPELMAEFYRQRQSKGGMTKAAALQKAQLALLHGTGFGETLARRGKRTSEPVVKTAPKDAPKYTVDPKRPFAHPYYWASFVLIGNWQ